MRISTPLGVLYTALASGYGEKHCLDVVCLAWPHCCSTDTGEERLSWELRLEVGGGGAPPVSTSV